MLVICPWHDKPEDLEVVNKQETAVGYYADLYCEERGKTFTDITLKNHNLNVVVDKSSVPSAIDDDEAEDVDMTGRPVLD